MAAKTTTNKTLTNSWVQIASATDSFQISSPDGTIFIAYASSAPAGSIKGHLVVPNTIYGDYQTIEAAWARTDNTGSGIVAALTVQTA